MTPHRVLALLLVALLVFMAATPSRAEAIEPGTALAVAGAVIVVVILVAYLVVANVRERRAEAEREGTPIMLVALDAAPETESP
jgi:Na+/melibiose symporter-like transporter